MRATLGHERLGAPWAARLADAGRVWGAAAALAVLVLLNVAFTPHFAAAANAWNILLQNATTVMVTVGMTLVIATGGIDLSVGSVMALAAAVAAAAAPSAGGVGAVAAGLAAAAVVGALNGVLVTRFRVEPFITTLATLIACRGLAQVVCNNGEMVPLGDAAFALLGRGRVGPAPVPVIAAVAVVASAVFLVRATRLGRSLVAVGGNEAAARLAGVPVARTKLAVYLASALLAGLAGLIDAARLGAADPSNLGGGMEFAAIFGAVIGGASLRGGRAPVFGSVVGVLILAVIGAAFNMLLIPFAWALVLQAAIILAAVAVQRPRTE